MIIAIYGLGYVGLTAASCALKSGHRVFGVDTNSDKVMLLNRGECPIFEPGMTELLKNGVDTGNFSVSDSIGAELSKVDIAMICVGTPSQADGSHNMSFIVEVTRQIAKILAHLESRDSPLTLAYRSTMRPGSTEDLILPVLRSQLSDAQMGGVQVVYHPEFLRESTAIADYFDPPKIVYGTDGSAAPEMLEQLYVGIEAPRFTIDYKEAEMTKFIDNSFHALKVAFGNEIGRIATNYGISAETIHNIFVSDTKLNISGKYLRPGGAFGGSCLPKDVRALVSLSKDKSLSTPIIGNLISSNEAHKSYIYERVLSEINNESSLLLVGLSFKDNSDDLRESPWLDLASRLLKNGYSLIIYEPNFNSELIHASNLNQLLSEIGDWSDIIFSDLEQIRNIEFNYVLDARGNASSLGLITKNIININNIP